MNALDTLINICENDNLVNAGFKCCLVAANKHPHKLDGSLAKPNDVNDFVDIYDLLSNSDVVKNYEGIGISIQASNICAIDVDHCFSRQFDLTSADDRAKQIIELFKNDAYIEFSFSGNGMRVLFRHEVLDNYTSKYYIKNDRNSIEFYQPNNSFRYVTITGQTICNNEIKTISTSLFTLFLDNYMMKPIILRQTITTSEDDRDIETLLKLVRVLNFRNTIFQDLWLMTENEHITKLFCNIQGESKESHADFQLLSLLYEHITQDKEKLRQLFEASPYYQSKDYKHKQKWMYGNYRYFEYQFNNIRALHSNK